MAEAHSAHHLILLIGRSLYLAAVEAGLRAVPDVTVLRIERWSPAYISGAPDAVIVDSPSGFADAATRLASTFPHATIIEVSPHNGSFGVAGVWRGEQHTIETVQELVGLIL